tara:strand:+ start:3835 stop:4479 length:645 start_codon:yes stop_codon:yes gene_type:complete
MNDIIEAQYDISKKSKLKKFYESNKILIYSLVTIIIILTFFLVFYLNFKEKKYISLSDNYVKARVFIEDNNKTEATKILKKIIYSNDPTYSSLALFVIVEQNLIDNQIEISNLFDHLIENNKFEKEVKNLLLYKKALFSSNFVEESVLLNELKPLLSKETIWKAHALILIGDYYVSKKEYFKAKEFYLQILKIKNLQKQLYDYARSQAALSVND